MTETTGAGELLESLDRHFLAGCASLSTSQLAQHRGRGSCEDCTEAAGMAARERETERTQERLVEMMRGIRKG